MMSVYFLDHKAAAVIYKLDRPFTNVELDYILRRNGIQGNLDLSEQPASFNIPSEQVTQTSTPGGTYKVKNGDCLSKIAQKFRLGTNALANFNKIDPKKTLKAGQVIRIPAHLRTETTTVTHGVMPAGSPSLLPDAGSWSIPGIKAYAGADGTSLTIITDAARDYLAQQEATKTEEEKLPPRDGLEEQLFGKGI